MNTDPPSGISDVPDAIVTTVRGRRIMATRERTRTNGDESRRTPRIYWVITTERDRYVGWLADPQETEASLLASLQQWIDTHPLSVRHRPHGDRPSTMATR